MITGRERGGNAVVQEDGTHGKAAAQRLRQRVHVRDHTRLLGGEQRAGAPQTALHFVEDQGDFAAVTQLAQERQKRGRNRPYPAFPLNRLDDHSGSALGRDNASGCVLVRQRDDLDTRQQRLERAAIVGPVGRGERGEQPAMERSGERDDVRFARPFARELEGPFVRFGAGVTEECLAAGRERTTRQFRREALTGLGAVQVRDVHEPGIERAHHRFAEDGTVVAERVDGDAGDEVEIARSVLGDELRPFARHEDRANARVDAEQCAGVACDGRRSHAG